MLALVSGDVFVHMTQFVLYHSQTVADELRSTDGNLVFVLNPVLVIDFDQGIQQVFRFPDGGVADAEVDDGGVVTAQFGNQRVGIGVGGGTYASPDILDRCVYESVSVFLRRMQNHSSGRSPYGVAHLRGESFSGTFIRHFKIGNGKRVFRGELDRETQGGLRLVAECDGERGRFVQIDLLQSPADGKDFVQSQTADYLGHQCGRFQRQQLVVDVGIGLEDAQIGKVAH